jgi:hypothetical protein
MCACRCAGRIPERSGLVPQLKRGHSWKMIAMPRRMP